MSVIANYIAAFNTAYPQKKCEVEFAKKYQGEDHFHVVIDGERGPRTLTTQDMREATRGFLAGK